MFKSNANKLRNKDVKPANVGSMSLSHFSKCVKPNKQQSKLVSYLHNLYSYLFVMPMYSENRICTIVLM